jgi:hypothetical protein
MKVQPPLKWRDIGDHKFEESHVWFQEVGLVEVEVVDEIPPPKFNPPLTTPEAPVLILIRDIFQ